MKRPLLIALALALPAGIGAFLLLVDGGREPSRARAVPVARAEAHPDEPPPVVLVSPTPVVRKQVGDAYTNVLWAVKAELELLEARFLPKQEGVPTVGSGATARISGCITGMADQGVLATVRFLAGANAGRVLQCDADGRLGAVDLYPGLSVVEVRGPGILGSRRQLRLRRGQETLLNVGYSRPGTVFGKVQDASGKGIDNAEVVIDGTRVLTDAEGGFFVQAVAAGQVLCEVEKDGYALYEELVWVAGGTTQPKERMTFTLKPACELRLSVRGNAGGPGPAQVYLLSDHPEFNANSAFRNESFPWHLVNPIEVWPDRPVTIGKLRPEVIKVHVFRPGARAAVKPVNLAANLRDVVVELQPAPTLTGKVLQDGQPVLGAQVKLEAPDRVRATLGYFAEPSFYLETAVMPNLPPGLQETTTDKEGRFTFSAWADVSPVRYLEARGPGGGAWGGRFVQPDEEEVTLELEQVQLGESSLVLDFPGRHQGLPLELWIGGAPVSTQILADDQPLEVSKLLAGRWALTLTWHAQPVKPREEILIEDVKHVEVALPPECIEGQTEEQWKRAGKEYPHSN
ncbi:MAG: carboxypeptidase regulatory-like domain-containing protein [Planctomycetes bacterium]|nr:carboxypeptidase regulatory-like domain-containing protein [Planctomycetota bacterium]